MTDILAKAGFKWKLPKWSEERVTDPRPLYFDVSSDLLSENLNEIILLVANVFLYEFAILIMGRCKVF